MNDEPPESLYVHVPFCAGKCLYCDFYSVVRSEAAVAAYLRALAVEADLAAQEAAGPFQTVYIGGGTPTVLTFSELDGLLRILREHFAPASDTEFTVEANPGTVTGDKLDVLARHGVNRLSLGAQSFNDRKLRTLGRLHDARDIADALAAARAAGFQNISLDMIFAAPGETPDDWRRDLDALVAANVPHVSTYSLTWEDETPLGRMLAAGRLARVGEEDELAMYEAAIDVLCAAGYEHYEISNFARPGRRCLHNNTYWANRAYVGLGPGAVGYLGGERRRNVASVQDYVRALEEGASPVDFRERLDAERRARETAVMNLRRMRGIDAAEFRRQTGFDVSALFSAEIVRFTRDGLMASDGRAVRLTRRGLMVADSVLAEWV